MSVEMSVETHAHKIAQYGIWPYADTVKKIKENDPLVPLLDAIYAFVTENPMLVLLPYCKARYAEETGLSTFHEAFVYGCISAFSSIVAPNVPNVASLFPHAKAIANIPDLADLGEGEPGEKSIEYIGTVVSYMDEKQKQYQEGDPIYEEWVAEIQN